MESNNGPEPPTFRIDRLNSRKAYLKPMVKDAFDQYLSSLEDDLYKAHQGRQIPLLHGLVAICPSSWLQKFFNKLAESDDISATLAVLADDYQQYYARYLRHDRNVTPEEHSRISPDYIINWWCTPAFKVELDRYYKEDEEDEVVVLDESNTEYEVDHSRRNAIIAIGGITAAIGLAIVGVSTYLKLDALERVREIAEELKEIGDEFKGVSYLKLVKNHKRYTGLLDKGTKLVDELIIALKDLEKTNTCINPEYTADAEAQTKQIIARFNKGDIQVLLKLARQASNAKSTLIQAKQKVASLVGRDNFKIGSDAVTSVISASSWAPAKAFAEETVKLVNSLSNFILAAERLSKALELLDPALHSVKCTEPVDGPTNDPLVNAIAGLEKNEGSDIEEMKRLARELDSSNEPDTETVKKLQRLLIKHKYLKPTYFSKKDQITKNSDDGDYGNTTRNAKSRMLKANR
ncbi:hypothetical protein ACFL2V_09415 [Pseudomonadota bacterium]